VVARVSVACLAPYTLRFNGAGSTGESTYQWTSDEFSSSKASVTHDYGAAGGTYVVGLKVTGKGGSDSAFVYATVPCS